MEYTEKDLVEFIVEANLHGIERIYEHDTLVYECYLHGGLVQ